MVVVGSEELKVMSESGSHASSDQAPSSKHVFSACSHFGNASLDKTSLIFVASESFFQSKTRCFSDELKSTDVTNILSADCGANTGSSPPLFILNAFAAEDSQPEASCSPNIEASDFNKCGSKLFNSLRVKPSRTISPVSSSPAINTLSSCASYDNVIRVRDGVMTGSKDYKNVSARVHGRGQCLS